MTLLEKYSSKPTLEDITLTENFIGMWVIRVKGGRHLHQVVGSTVKIASFRNTLIFFEKDNGQYSIKNYVLLDPEDYPDYKPPQKQQLFPI